MIHLLTLLVTLPLAAATSAEASYDSAADPHGFKVFMKDGGWCWYQDPRVMIHQGKLLIGSVQGNRTGPAVVGLFDLEADQPLGKVVMRDNFKRDDHNAPVFYRRPDGSVLAMYALHGNNRDHYYRISSPHDPLRWGKENSFVHQYPAAGNVTYMNLYALKAEGKLYNFFRGIEFNPSFITSSDHGKTWGEPTHLIKSELEGRHRPYARYAGNDVDTIHICFTDGHPRQFGNSIYYAAFRGGKFFRANGGLIKDLHRDGPLRPSEADLVYRGSGQSGRGVNLSAVRSAWTSSIAIDQRGHPTIGYTLYLSNSDHRYRVATWDGMRWVDRQVAYAGGCLYDRESSYTGLITLDPVDPSTVVVSSDVDPKTGRSTGGKHEIYQATIGLGDDVNSIRWTAITKDSPVRNLRPVIVRGDGKRVIAWLRGDFRTYTNYQLDVVGVVDPANGTTSGR